jgi:uncharacterized membrane protein
MMNWYLSTGWVGMFAMVLGWAGLFAVAVWLVARATRTEHPVQPTDPARSIVDERFASGEISAEEYAQMRRSMTQAPGPKS